MPTPTERQALFRSLFSLAATPLVMGALLFGPAGSFAWPRGWWFLAAFVAALVISMVVLWRLNPKIFVARSKIGRGTKGWDYWLLSITIRALVAVLDDARFRWMPTPSWVVILGYALLAASFALTIWAQAVNRHFEPSVRIQSDRDHTVIDIGPYAIIRHPGYIAGTLMGIGMALSLGSLWALVPLRWLS